MSAKESAKGINEAVVLGGIFEENGLLNCSLVNTDEGNSGRGNNWGNNEVIMEVIMEALVEALVMGWEGGASEDTPFKFNKPFLDCL